MSFSLEDDEDSVICVFDQEAVFFFAFLKGFFCLSLFGDVSRDLQEINDMT
jgi:hypothetical protein